MDINGHHPTRNPHLVQFAGHSAYYGLVSEVEMKPLKVHLPVDALVSMCLRSRVRTVHSF